LIRPTEEEKDLQNLSTISEKKLRPEFLKMIEELKIKIKRSIKPKRIKGKCITAQGYL
jgi:hypothetical protein